MYAELDAADEGVVEEAASGDTQPSWWYRSFEHQALLSEVRAAAIRRLAGFGGGLLVLHGLTVLFGFVTENYGLASIGPGDILMSPWTAVGFVLLGLGILLPTVRDRRATRRTAIGLAAVTIVLSVYFGVETVAGVTGPFDDCFGLFPVGGVRQRPVPALATLVSLVLIGASLIALKVHHVRSAQLTALVPIGIGGLSLVGYAMKVDTLYAPARVSTMALQTAGGIVLAGLSVLMLRADRGVMRIVSGQTAGGQLARHVLPAVALGPIAAAVLADAAVRGGVVDGPFAVALLVTVIATVGVFGVLVEASRLQRLDLRLSGTDAALNRVRELEEDRRRSASELRTAYRRLDGVLTTALDAFITLDEDGVVLSWNPAAEQLSGYPAAEAIGQRIDRLLVMYHDDGSSLGGRIDARTIGSDEDLPGVYSVVRKDGRLTTVETRVWPQDVDGRITYTAVVRDVHDEVRRRRELEEANRSLDEFTAIVAHDLRGPLTAIRGLAELLHDEAVAHGDATGIRLTRRLDNATTRGVDLIEDLLAFSRAGRAVETVPVDLAELAREVGEQLTATVDRPFELVVGPIPAVAGDRATLRQLVVNLVGNAVRYCPEGREPHVHVHTDDDGSTRDVLVYVDDNGDGIADDERATVFDMFRRGSSGRGLSGSGVGLAICRKVVEVHDGSISIDRSPSGGARFAVTLPRAA